VIRVTVVILESTVEEDPCGKTHRRPGTIDKNVAVPCPKTRRIYYKEMD